MTTDSEPTSADVEHHRPRVLVVDGDVERSHRFAVWLAGHEVTCTHRGADALDYLREAEFEVVVVARRLPDMSGAAVLSSIRDRRMDVRVAMVLAPGDSLPVTSAELDTVLERPLSPAALAGAVTDLLTRRDRQRLWLELSSKRVRRNVRSFERTDVDPIDIDLDQLTAEIERQASRLAGLPGGASLITDGGTDD